MNAKAALRNVALGAIATLAMTACGGGGGGDNSPTLGPLQGLIFAADEGGNLNIFEDRGTTPIARSKTLSFSGLALSEILMNKGKALVVVSSGLPGVAEPTRDSGGVAVVDLATQSLDQIVTLESTMTGRNARLVHAYLDPAGKYFWVNNDGPSGDAGVDSVFRINVDPADPGYLTDVTEILTGNGHHKSAFSGEGTVGAKKLFVTSNLSASSLSVIDNDPANVGTYGTVIKTVSNIGFVPHGMDYSPVSGHVYTGITGGGVVILDATSDDIVNAGDYDFNANPLPVDASVSKIPASQIPKAGYVHVANNGNTVYTTGYDSATGTGYLSAIDASNNDAVIGVLNIGNVSSSSFDVAGTKLYIPSRASATGNPKTNVVEVVDISNPASMQILREITVGEAGDHRNGEVTADGSRVVYPDTCSTCKNIRVIDTATDTVIDTLVSEGNDPAAVGTALY